MKSKNKLHDLRVNVKAILKNRCNNVDWFRSWYRGGLLETPYLIFGLHTMNGSLPSLCFTRAAAVNENIAVKMYSSVSETVVRGGAPNGPLHSPYNIV